MRSAATITAFLLPVGFALGGCAPTAVRPGQDLTPLVGKRVEIEGGLAKATYQATGNAQPAAWCLTLANDRPQVRGTSELAFDGQTLFVDFKPGQSPPDRATRGRVVGTLARDGANLVVRDATWTPTP